MTLRLEDKQAIVAELHSVATSAISVVAADYRSLTVSDMTALHKGAREKGVHMRVYRNTLARRAVKDTDFACLVDALTGPIVLFFAQDEPGAAARLVSDFMKVNEQLEVKALAMDGQLLGPDALKAVAALPSRDEAIARLMSVMQAPVTKFVRTLNEPVAQFMRCMGQVRDQKQAA
ncbi:MAG: 50S ribosomal protein L10 [Coxiella sp. (in: Bacteria)]|nr:MAG: 50S ribosomal protein L10 [Coxiella sp. (in: g-proteobacteria)]